MNLYEPSDSTIWTDPYIREQLLQAHLNPQTDAASRTPQTIQSTVDWILGQAPAAGNLLDLGCGPGLYAEVFTEHGWQVLGVDINPASVVYAQRSAKAKGLEIEYLEANYLRTITDKTFDLVICVYCDFGALLPEQQRVFLENVYERLVPGGQVVFDVFGDGISATKLEGRNWSEEGANGFWSAEPCYVLSETEHFVEQRVWGQKYILIQPQQKPKTFVLWDHYFTPEQLRQQVEVAGFELLEIKTGLIPKNDFACDDVLFVQARKPKR